MNIELTNAFNLIETALNNGTIDVDIVNAIIDISRKINALENPNFTENGVSVMDNFDDFADTGLSNCDYIRTGFYKNKIIRNYRLVG
jgi:hypothetical protein